VKRAARAARRLLKLIAECAVIFVEGHALATPHMLVSAVFGIVAAAINRPLTRYAQVTVKN
jgi:hypothetical protein